ncbi:MAG: hypothetical protein KDC85_11040 [Saprospiraceae bacterium]|nr:hypothetical protein [Saprospiraceae bacterium]MCB9322427.1 hypothetical protein [Lewinellaceae bacterium]
MSDKMPNWSKNEFLGYLFMYCAHADYIETEEEKDLIKSKIDKEVYQKIHQEFDGDNDYESIEKIVAAAGKYYPTPEAKEILVSEIMKLFLSDGTFDTMERNIFLGLKRLILT